MSDRIGALIAAAAPAATALRHQLHRIPELAGNEFATSALLRERLKELDVEVLEPFIGTDAVGFIRGRAPGPNVTLRADIDALPLAEKTGLPYASTRPGLMHACGHDGHAAMLWGAIRVLAELRGEFSGTVRFVFQPGEEVAAMARDLIAAGALESPAPDFSLALHGWTESGVGTLEGRAGTIMAAAGFFRVVIHGVGGHGSKPEKANNPLSAAALLIERLHRIPETAKAREKVVATVCHAAGGANGNVIPDTALVEGTVRFLNDADGLAVRREFDAALAEVEARCRVACEAEYTVPYIPTVNAPAAVGFIREQVIGRIPGLRWRELEAPSMGGEDFGYFLDRAPGVFLRLGLGTDRPPAHHPQFDFNDDAIPYGIAVLVHTALEFLNREGCVHA